VWFGAELRRRGRQQLALALLVGFVGAAALTCVAAARRTDSSYQRYLAAQAIPDLEVNANIARDDVPALARSIAQVPGVRAAGAYDVLYAAPDRPDVLPGDDFLVFAPADEEYTTRVDRPVVISGRLPRADAPDEVLVNERAAKTLHLRVGTRTRLRSFGPDEGAALQAGDFDALTFNGGAPTVRVVGIGRTRLDLFATGYAPQYFMASRAFGQRQRDAMFGYGALIDVRLDGNSDVAAVEAAIADLLPNGEQAGDVQRLAFAAKGLRDAARVQSISLLLVALTALAAGVVVVSQAIGRAITASAQEHSTLAALGVDRRGRAWLAAVGFLPAAIGAAALAVAAAWAASRWFPTGAPRRAEVSRGTQFDTRVLLLGAVLIVLGVVARAAFGAWRQHIAAAQLPRPLRSGWLDRATSALPPATALGLRWAVGRRDGSLVRPRAGLLPAIIGVAGLLAVVMYTSGIDRVVSTPSAYGWTFDATVGGGDDARAVAHLRDAVLRDQSIGDVGVVTILSPATVDGSAMQGWAFGDVRGHIGPTVVRGRPPARDGEVLLGTKSAEALGVGIGDVVHSPRTQGAAAALRVVGLGLFPTIETDNFTNGMVTTPGTARQLRTSTRYENVVFRWRPGTDVDAAVARLGDARIATTLAAPVSDVANLRIVRAYPRWLAIFLVGLGLLATAHALVVSTRRRRHEMGVLRAVGFSQRQLWRATSTQGAIVGIIAVAVGTPLGLALGRWVWVTHADRIGIGTTNRAPFGAVAFIALTTVVLTWLIATAAARRASRTQLAKALRVE
jgi:putative ABC transport system permease protein